MEYKLKLSAMCEDFVPLHFVAVAMAMRDATAGGTPYHKPTFQGRLTGYILDLLDEVRSGRLVVCNSFGSLLPVDSGVDATEHFGFATKYVKEPDWEKLHREIAPIGEGVWDFSHINFGPKETDKNRPNILWNTKLKLLNDWAGKRGDTFVISYEGGWHDERGYVEPQDMLATNQTTVPHKANELKTKEKDRSLPLDPTRIDRNQWYGTDLTARFLGMNLQYFRNNLVHNRTLAGVKRDGGQWKFKGQNIITYIEGKATES